MNYNTHPKKYFFSSSQVRGFYERAAQKLRDDGAFITHMIENDHDNAVKDIFDNQDLNYDGFITSYEFSRSRDKNVVPNAPRPSKKKKKSNKISKIEL